METYPFQVGIVFWQEDDEIASLIALELENLGCKTINFLHNAKLPEDLDIVLVYGPFGSLVPIANQLLACPSSRRPLFILWMTEQFPNPAIPEWARHTGGIIRSRIERLAFRQNSQGEWIFAPRLRWVTSKMHRFRYYGDLYWLKDILSVLAIASPWTADFLHTRGFDSILAYPGLVPSDCGADLGLERDIPVLWIGKTGSKRREHLLRRIRAELRERGVEMLMVDGVEHPYVFGEDRTILLNRTKITLNLLRAKWDDNSMRYCLAAPNRVLIVTEPTLPHTPFLPNIHLVEAPVEQIADNICFYLAHEKERQQIVERAYQLATTEVTMHNGLVQILEHVVMMKKYMIPA
jgi:hypothetical protein